MFVRYAYYVATCHSFCLNAVSLTSLFQLGSQYYVCYMEVCSGDMTMPARIQEAMQMQVEAERKKRAAILESEGK